MLEYLSLDIICSSKLTVFRERTVRFSEQIMSADRYPAYFRARGVFIYLRSKNGQGIARATTDRAQISSKSTSPRYACVL